MMLSSLCHSPGWLPVAMGVKLLYEQPIVTVARLVRLAPTCADCHQHWPLPALADAGAGRGARRQRWSPLPPAPATATRTQWPQWPLPSFCAAGCGCRAWRLLGATPAVSRG